MPSFTIWLKVRLTRSAQAESFCGSMMATGSRVKTDRMASAGSVVAVARSRRQRPRHAISLACNQVIHRSTIRILADERDGDVVGDLRIAQRKGCAWIDIGDGAAGEAEKSLKVPVRASSASPSCNVLML